MIDTRDKLYRLQTCCGASLDEALKFLKMYEEMKEIEIDEDEEIRLEHARLMSQKKPKGV